MRNLGTVGLASVLTILGLSLLTACAGRMDGGKETMKEKGDAMNKGGSMTEREKAMMKETSGAMKD